MPRFRTRLTLLAAASAIPGIAQAQASSFGSGKAVGVTVQTVRGFEGFDDNPLAVGFHFTLIRASGPDFDFEIATMPLVLGVIATDVGVGHTFPIGGGALMLEAGPSAVLIIAHAASGAWWGLHGGAIMFLRLARNLGIRLEATPRWYSVDGEMLSGATFGMGLTSLPTPGR